MRFRNFQYTVYTLLLFIFGIGVPVSVYGQLSPSAYEYPHNHLPWYTIESEHFLVHFQKGNSRSAQVASRIAEEVYPGITDLYNLEPDTKVSITLTDRQDYSNGAAYFFDNQIRIWVPALNTPLRGTNDWLRDVISHEFTHIVQLQAAMKKSRHLPAIYFQWLSYEEVRRPDVLYGYPKGVITHPFASISIPAWLAEGSAQFQRLGWFYDTWDSHRDMILRSAVLHDKYLSLEEMGIFSSKNSLEREQVYNQGFAFTTYLVQQYGEEILPELTGAFSNSGVFSTNQAIKQVTGKSGKHVFEEWIRDRKAFYDEATGDISVTGATAVEDDGFFNFFPRFSPDGNHIAYLSNKGSDESRTALYLREDGKKDVMAAVLSERPSGNRRYSCGFTSEPAINDLHSGFSFSKDGQKIAFTRTTLNSYGEQYDDLFIKHVNSGKEEQLTYSRRISSPAWHPEDDTLAAILQYRGTQNVVLLDISTGSISHLTDFTHGEQVFTPAWHPDGDALYFAFSRQKGRNIQRISLPTGEVSPVLEDPYIDYRDPFVDPEGLFLYYASDEDGIFNIYRKPVHGTGSTRLTNVIGGAFMPSVNENGRMLYSEFKENRYQISSLELNRNGSNTLPGRYNPPFPAENNFTDIPESGQPEEFDNRSIDAFSETMYEQADTAAVPFSLQNGNEGLNRDFYEYEETFTGLSFYPVLRFDNYSRKNGSNGSLIRSGRLGDFGENLLRDMKLGTYISSREVIDRLSIFGGALFGFGSRKADGIGNFFSPSRLSDLDRDLFLVTEYRGLPFIKKRWSPTVSLELYNLRRNVNNGLSIEEFPCTSCLPDTLKADIAYNIWEADLYLRSKIDESNLLELGVGYTPYRVQTDGFFSRELEQFIPSSSTEYFKGTFLSASHVLEMNKRYRHSDIAPLGVRSFFKYTYETGKLLEEYAIEDGTISPVYRKNNNHSFEWSSQYGFRINERSTGLLNGRVFSYLNNPGDSFYLDYIGGFTGMRSYPFFALGGNTTAYGQFSHIFPLLTGINKQVGKYTMDKLFLRVFGEAGTTWNSPLHSDQTLKTGIGTEVRFAFNSYYLFPLKLFLSASYGFNKFDVTLPDEFITVTPTGNVSYGKEVLIHFGLTFDFNVINND